MILSIEHMENPVNLTPFEFKRRLLAGETFNEPVSVGGSLDLSGCTGLTALLIDEARDYALHTTRNATNFFAGCRKFTRAEALAHWGSENYPDKARGARYLKAVLAAIEAADAAKCVEVAS